MTKDRFVDLYLKNMLGQARGHLLYSEGIRLDEKEILERLNAMYAKSDPLSANGSALLRRLWPRKAAAA